MAVGGTVAVATVMEGGWAWTAEYVEVQQDMVAMVTAGAMVTAVAAAAALVVAVTVEAVKAAVGPEVEAQVVVVRV